MKIRKHQAGGMVYTPVQTIYGDNEGAEKAPSSSSDKSESKLEDTISKDIVEVLATKGIPVDVSVFLAKANSLLNTSKFENPAFSSNKYSKLIQLHQLANEIHWNKTLYDTAQTRIKEGLTGSDYALSDNGEFYVMDKNRKISTKSYDELVKNKGQYMLLTNNQLLQERAHSAGNQYNSEILRDVSNYVGMNEIMDDVRGIINEIGTQENKGYVNKIGGQAQRGFEYLNNIMNGENGLYEFTTEGSKSMRDIESALNYIKNSLNPNAKNTLKANSKLQGINENQMILSAIFEHTDEVRRVDKVDEDENSSGSKGGSKSGSGTKENVTYLQAVANGRQVQHKDIVLGKSSDKGGIKVSAQPYMILDDQLKSIPQNNMEQVLNQAQIGKIVDVNSISMGDQYIPYEHLNRIMWDKSNAYRMRLPVDQSAKYMGIIKPDLEVYKRFQKFESWYNDHPGVTSQQIIQKMQELNLNLIPDATTGKWRFRDEDSELFLATSGYVNTQAIDVNTKSGWFDHLSETDGEHLIKQYETVTNLGTISPTKSSIASDNVKLGTWGLRWLGADGGGKFYKAPIFMPIVDVGLSFTADEKEYTLRENMEDVLQRREYQDEVRSIRSQF
jgi:hypothetical protein